MIRALRWSERYTKTDMVYLAATGWWTNLNLVFTSLLSFALSIAFANLLSPETYGVYQYLISLSAIIAAVSLSGMGSAVAQAAARGYEGVLSVAVRAQLKWAIIPGLLASAGALYYFRLGNVELGIGLVFIALCVPLTIAYGTYGGFLEGKREFRQLFLLSLTTNSAYYASMFIAVAVFKDAATLIAVNLAITALGAFYAYRRTRAHFQSNDRIDPATISYGRRLSVLAAFTTAITQMGAVLVFHFLGAASLAIYSFATLIPERIGGLFNFVGAASLPRFANQSLANIKQNILSKSARVFTISMLAVLGYCLLAPILFHLLLPRYLSVIPYTEAYAFIIALLAVSNITGTTLYAKRLTKEIYIRSFSQPLLLIGLQIPLLLAYGIWGMIIARLVSEAVSTLLTLVLLFRAQSEN
jgi:O-antigen/teichoic acid export membrane protein